MDATVAFQGLSEVANVILDFLLNVPSTHDQEGAIESVYLCVQAPRQVVLEEWDSLIQQGVIVKTNAYYSVTDVLVGDAKTAVEQYLIEKETTKDSTEKYLHDLFKQSQRNFAALVNLIGKVYVSDGVERSTFSDSTWYNEPLSVYDELVKQRIAFRVSSSSKKYYYKSYYLRGWPFDSGQILRDAIARHLNANVEGLTAVEWKLLFLLLIGKDSRLKYETLAGNMAITDSQLRETVTRLKEGGFLDETAGDVFLIQGVSAPLSEYFKTNVYPRFKDSVVKSLKQAIAESLSNLWLFAGAKRLCELPVSEARQDPVTSKVIEKNTIPEFGQHFGDMCRLGLILDLDNKIVIISDIVKDIENWLRSSIYESIVFIPANDFYLAGRVLRDIFSNCETYVKIQDAFLGVETFNVLEYIPNDVQIQVLGGIKLGSRENPNNVCQRIERFMSEREGHFEIRFVAKANEVTPFHDRFIISRDHCWTTGTSLKQIGGEKATSITGFSKDKGGEQIELAFDSLWDPDPEDLHRRGYVKLTFDEWKARAVRV